MENEIPKSKYIFITGGVVSSLGKGTAAASIGALLKSRGYTVHARKFDPYLNVDPGAMSPLQHGEVYVTDDGHETDLDLGYYERFLGIKLSKSDSVSGGRIYWDVLDAERRGEYKGATVQIIPHITNKIKEYIGRGTGTDFVVCEIGGTVGDIEGQVFLEAARQFANDIGRRNVMFAHMTLAPYLEKSGELKTKPTQMSTRQLLETGIQADMLIVRSPRMLEKSEQEKIALFCNLPSENVISGIDVGNIYQIPLEFERQGVFPVLAKHFDIEDKAGDLSELSRIEKYLSDDLPNVTIAVFGKYFDTPDSYKSMNEALFHAGIKNNIRVKIRKASDIRNLDGADGILAADNADMSVADYARKNNIPFLSVGLGFLRMSDQCEMIRGAQDSEIVPGTLAWKIYGNEKISERRRHKFRLPVEKENELKKLGLSVSGKSDDGKFVDIVEIPDRKFFIAVQFRPEFQSNPYAGHPLFAAFVAAASK